MLDYITDISGRFGFELEYAGPAFEKPFSVVINSHQGRFPMCAHPWVRNTINAIKALSQFPGTMLSSAGLNSYELPLWHAGSLGMDQILVIPLRNLEQAGTRRERLLQEFNLAPGQTGFLFFKSSGGMGKSPNRDRLILEMADRILPVAVKGKGRIQGMLSALNPRMLDRRFEVPFETPKTTFSIPEVSHPLATDPNWPYLTHWTRRSSGPFPGETPADYYQSILNTRSEYSHSSLHSLRHILGKQVIQGSVKGIRGGYEVVSFTALPPVDAVKLKKWNPSRIRFTFEPHGIAIHKRYLEEIGARPVIYGAKEDFRPLSKADRPFYQYWGKHRKWTGEQEWRIGVDLHLADIPEDRLLVLVPDQKDAGRIERKFKGYRVVPLGG